MQLKVRHTKGATGDLDVDCPFCHTKSKMNLCKEKNVFRCVVCDAAGGQVKLYADYFGIDNKAAYRDIVDLLNCGETKDAPKPEAQTPKTPTKEEPKRADRETTHQTYAMMLSSLSLAAPHREQLLARGLSIDNIVKFGYKSVPAYGQQKLCAELLKSGCTLEGVPGFYKDEEGKWSLRLKASGLIIPISGLDGRIEAMQIRLDKPPNDRKYIWLTSKGLDCGVTSGSPLHFVGDPAAKKVYITEGALKGAVAHGMTDYTFICLAGVKSTGKLNEMLEVLKANGTTIVIEAFDMDKYTNIHVEKAAENLRKMIESHGFKVQSATWENKDLKGIDDYYYFRWLERQKGVHAVDIANAG